MKKEEIIRYNPEVNLGLTTKQVNQRKQEKNVNANSKKYSKSYLSIFFDNFCTFYNLLGLIVTLGLIYAGAQLFDFVFVFIFLMNILIGIIQEIRAKICIDRLSVVSNKTTKVIRDGLLVEISSSSVVLDDIISLSLGSQIPTDCVLIDGLVEVNESILTGESEPVKKKPGDILLRGSYVTSGNCFARADKVGKNNYIEKLSEKAKKYKKPHSELMHSLSLIIKSVGFIIIPIAILYLVKSYQFYTIQESIKRTSTVVIGMIPSGMFFLTSMTLAVGIIKLARHKTLVQDLYSLEILARVNTICFDKTGTITDGKMVVQKILYLNKSSSYNINDILSSMLGTTKDNNQTAIALFNKVGDEVKYQTENFLPFNSTRKFSAVRFKDYGSFAFGAPEMILSDYNYNLIKNDITEHLSKGLRVLVLAHSDNQFDEKNIPSDFLPVAFVVLVDNIREDAYDTVKWFKENDVEIKVISGDNPITVSEVSKRVGIDNADNYISLEGLTDDEVYNCATKYTVFGRVSPEQKAILVRALKDSGRTTAMTGDGVNDILALKEADCAISVASGSESTKNISHLVLLDNNFSSMPKIVYEGRRVINNIQNSTSLYLMKTIFTILFSIITFFITKSYPFELKQMNLLEILIIGLPSFSLSLQPNKERVKGTFIDNVLKKSLSAGLLMTICALTVILAKIFLQPISGLPDNIYSTMGIFALTYAGLISLHHICTPMNKFRRFLFTFVFVVLSLITFYTIVNGLDFLKLSKLTPLNYYWHHILIIIAIVFIAMLLSKQLNALTNKIKFTPNSKKRFNIK